MRPRFDSVPYAALVVLFLVTPRASQAVVENRNLMPSGELEALQGNAGVAGTASSGAVYYNPAGLAQIEEPRVSVVGNSYVSSSSRTALFAQYDNTNLAYSSSGFDTVPSTVVGTFRLFDGTAAYSILVPEQRRLENRQTLRTPNSSTTLLEVQSAAEMRAGVSFGKWVTSELALGFSGFIVQRKDSEVITAMLEFPAIANTNNLLLSHVQASTYTLGFTLGAFWKCSETLTIGARFETPSLALSGKAAGFVTSQNLIGGVLTATTQDEPEIEARAVTPFDSTLGIRWSPNSSIQLLADLSLQLGSEFDPYPNSTFGGNVKTSFTSRVNLGGAFSLSDTLSLHTGLMMNPSVFHSLEGRAEGSTRGDFWGATGGFFLTSGKVRTGVGAFYLWSQGEIVPVGLPNQTAAFDRSILGGTLMASYSL